MVGGNDDNKHDQENSRPGNSDGATHVQMYNKPATHCDAAMIHMATWPADGAAALPIFFIEPQFVRTMARYMAIKAMTTLKLKTSAGVFWLMGVSSSEPLSPLSAVRVTGGPKVWNVSASNAVFELQRRVELELPSSGSARLHVFDSIHVHQNISFDVAAVQIRHTANFDSNATVTSAELPGALCGW